MRHILCDHTIAFGTSVSGIADRVIPLEILNVIIGGKTGIGLRDHRVPVREEVPQVVLDDFGHTFSDTDHMFRVRRGDHLSRVRLP